MNYINLNSLNYIQEEGIMEKYYQDYAYHLRLAVQWYALGRMDYHKAHLDWANKVLADFKAKIKQP